MSVVSEALGLIIYKDLFSYLPLSVESNCQKGNSMSLMTPLVNYLSHTDNKKWRVSDLRKIPVRM